MDQWDFARPYLESALEYNPGTHTIEDVRDAILRQQMLLICGKKCAMVYEVIAYPRLKILHGFLCGGDLTELKSFDPYLVELAKALGCERISIAGRQGWVRALKDLNYKTAYTVVGKEV